MNATRITQLPAPLRDCKIQSCPPSELIDGVGEVSFRLHRRIAEVKTFTNSSAEGLMEVETFVPRFAEGLTEVKTFVPRSAEGLTEVKMFVPSSVEGLTEAKMFVSEPAGGPL